MICASYNKMTVKASIWTGGNPKGFLIHVISAMNYIERIKLFEEWTSTKKAKEWHSKHLRDVLKYLNQLIENQKKAPAEITMAKKKN